MCRIRILPLPSGCEPQTCEAVTHNVGRRAYRRQLDTADVGANLAP